MEYRKPDDEYTTRRASTPHLRRIIKEFYQTTLDDYRQAGCPFGTSVEAMLIWFEFGQETTLN